MDNPDSDGYAKFSVILSQILLMQDMIDFSEPSRIAYVHHFHHKTLRLPVIERLDWIHPREEAGDWSWKAIS
jgi:hypothetical protein